MASAIFYAIGSALTHSFGWGAMAWLIGLVIIAHLVHRLVCGRWSAETPAPVDGPIREGSHADPLPTLVEALDHIDSVERNRRQRRSA